MTQEQIDNVTERIAELLKLGHNWDSYHGIAIDATCIGESLHLLEFYKNHADTFEVFPLSCGGVNAEIVVGDVEIEIDIMPKRKAPK